jgi:hypothetical protein
MAAMPFSTAGCSSVAHIHHQGRLRAAFGGERHGHTTKGDDMTKLGIPGTAIAGWAGDGEVLCQDCVTHAWIKANSEGR